MAPRKPKPPTQLELLVVELRSFCRIYASTYPDPLGYGKGPSRFGDPRKELTEDQRFGVLYLGESFAVAFAETLIRDGPTFRQGAFFLPFDELKARLVAEVGSRAPLRLVDLSGRTPIRMGIPSDVAKRENHSSGMRWSLALHEHPDEPDGILYRSRLDDSFLNIAIYGRAVERLNCERILPLVDHPELPLVLHRYGVRLE